MTLNYASQNETRNTQDKQESAGKKSEEKSGGHEAQSGEKSEQKKEEKHSEENHDKKEAEHKVEGKKEAAGHDQKEGHDKDGKNHSEDKDPQKKHESDADQKHAGDKEGEHSKDGHGESGHNETGHGEKSHGTDASHGKSADGHGSTDGHGDGHASNPLSPEALFGHVLDTEDIHLPPTVTRLFMGEKKKLDSHGHPVLDKDGKEITVPHDGVIGIPQPFKGTISYKIPLGEEHTKYLRPLDLNISRLMVVELVAAVIIFVLFTWLARQIRPDRATKGRIAGLLETIVQFVRKDVGIAVMGKGDGRRFAPFLLTIFFFVLGCNLLGMIPTVGAPTGDILVTGSLALCVFATVVYAGMQKFGFVGFFGNLVPTMGVEGPLGVVLSIGMFFIELFGFFVKHFVLAVRLFANIMAGHLVLAAIIGFIALTYNEGFLVYLVAPASVAGSVALSCLEVFVAFLQAYVFTFLSALFISSATHKH